MPADRDLAQAVTQPVDARQCRERVVDRLGQRPDRDLDELVDAEGDVLREGPVRPGDVSPPERVVTPMCGTKSPCAPGPIDTRTSTAYTNVATNVPSVSCVARSRMKLRSIRGPNCVDARVR